MGTSVNDRVFSGAGRVYLGEIDSVTKKPKGFLHVGNVPVCKISLSTETEDLYESMSGNQLLTKRIPRKKTAELSLNLSSWSKENLAIALYGTSATVTGSTANDEAVTAYLGKDVPLLHVSVSAVTVENSTGLITYVVDKNYTVDADYGTIHIMTTAEQTAAGATDMITEAQALLVNYTFAGYDKTSAFTNTGKEYALRLEGVNSAEDGEKFLVIVHRFVPAPIKDWSLIDDKTGPIDISGAVIADTTRADGDQFVTEIRM